MSTRTLFPLYHIYVECKENFSWIDCDETISKKLTGQCNLFAMVNDELEDIQNALLESHEDISHINAQVTELFFVAIPSSNFSFRDFIKFAKIDLNEIVGSVRVVNPDTKQHSICIKFQNIENAQKCFLRCHGKRYMNKNDICHVLFAVKFEIVQTEELLQREKQMALHKYLQLPLCPSCLERLDPTITNVWPHYCDEVESSSFYNQITNVSIPSSAPSSNQPSAQSSPVKPNSRSNSNADDQPQGTEEEEATNGDTNRGVVGIDDDNTDFHEFVYDNHHTATSAGVCRCILRWKDLHCKVCKRIREMTKKQMQIEQEEEEQEEMKNNPKKQNKKKDGKDKKNKSHKHKHKHHHKHKNKKKSKEEEEDESKYDNSDLPECCQNIVDSWACLICGHAGCGRFSQSHALDHYDKYGHPFCVNLQTLSVWDYTNDVWQHRLFQKRTLTNEMQRERDRMKQREHITPGGPDDTHITPGGPTDAHHITPGGPDDDGGNHNNGQPQNDDNRNRNSNNLQPMDEFSRATVYAKLDNMKEYYNRMVLDVIQQQTECYDEQMRDIKRHNDIECNEKKKVIQELKKKSKECDKTREAIELWNKIQEMRQKNLLKKKEFQQTVNKTRQHKKELEKMKARYDKKEQRMREQKAKQKQAVQKEIDRSLDMMTQ